MDKLALETTAWMTVTSGTPAYVQVAADLRSQIERGELPPGAQLPSSAQLQKKYSVSKTVIRDAINELRHADLVVSQQGKGVFVRSGEANEGPLLSMDSLDRRVQAIEERLDASSTGDHIAAEVQGLRRQLAVMRTHIIDLYARMGFPYPRDDEESPPDSSRSSRSA